MKFYCKVPAWQDIREWRISGKAWNFGPKQPPGEECKLAPIATLRAKHEDRILEQAESKLEFSAGMRYLCRLNLSQQTARHHDPVFRQPAPQNLHRSARPKVADSFERRRYPKTQLALRQRTAH